MATKKKRSTARTKTATRQQREIKELKKKLHSKKHPQPESMNTSAKKRRNQPQVTIFES